MSDEERGNAATDEAKTNSFLVEGRSVDEKLVLVRVTVELSSDFGMILGDEGSVNGRVVTGTLGMVGGNMPKNVNVIIFG